MQIVEFKERQNNNCDTNCQSEKAVSTKICMILKKNSNL